MRNTIQIIVLLLMFAPLPVFSNYSVLASHSMPKTVEINVDGKILGSGVFISTSGHVLTAAHLFNFSTVGGHLSVSGQDITVWVYPGDVGHKMEIEWLADVVDLALLVPSKSFKTTPIELAKTAIVGEEVISIGSPLGLSWSVTAGIISRLGGLIKNKPMLYSDVSINSGNSGGPLINKKGRLVGIASMIYTDGGMFNGISMFIDLPTIKKFLDMTRGPK